MLAATTGGVSVRRDLRRHVEKRERAGANLMLRAPGPTGGADRGSMGRYRADGMRRDLRGAAKAWVWLVVASPGLLIRKAAVSGCARSAFEPGG